MPIDYRNYPVNWKTEIRPAILERAGHKCERCGVANYAQGMRDSNGKFYPLDVYLDMGWDEQDVLWPNNFPKCIKIILTIAHIHNHDPMDCRPENLQALCQKCHHLTHNSHQRREQIQRDRDEESGQMQMFDDVLGE